MNSHLPERLPENDVDIRPALGHAGQRLYLWAKEQIEGKDHDVWQRLERSHAGGDISEAIGTILQLWDPYFRRYPLRVKDLLRDARELRNKWAHPIVDVEFGRDDAFRLVDSLARAMKELEIDAPELMDELEHLKVCLLAVVRIEQAQLPDPDENKVSVPPVLADPPAKAVYRPQWLAVPGLVIVVLAIGLFTAQMWHGNQAIKQAPASPVVAPKAVAPKMVRTFVPKEQVRPSKNEQLARRAREDGMRLYREGVEVFAKTGSLSARNVLFEKAIEKFSRAEGLSPRNPEPLFNHAVILNETDRLPGALTLFHKASALCDASHAALRKRSEAGAKRIEFVLKRAGTQQDNP